jgi:hypothetical protein
MVGNGQIGAAMRPAAVLLSLGGATTTVGLLAAQECRRLWAQRTHLAFDDLVLSLAVAVLTLALAWLCLATLLTATTQVLRGSTGVVALVADRVTPPLCRRVVTLACGAVVLTAPVAASASAAGTVAPCRPSCGPSLLPAPYRPVPRGPTAGAGDGGPDSVTVRPGDTLWTVAAQHLPGPVTNADTAAAWPLWFRTNRARLGPDPHLIHPGTRLRVPPRFDRTG